jgi:hypothetical protein
VKKKKEKVFYLVYDDLDGWVVHTNKKEATLDYKVCSKYNLNAKFVKVREFKQVKTEK